MLAFLERGTHFLQVAGDFRVGIFGCGEIFPLRKRRMKQAGEGGVLMVEEESGMLSKLDICL